MMPAMSGSDPRAEDGGDRRPDAVGPAERDFGDPTRRTYFAEERTLLAWWRSSLAAIAVALAVGRLFPALTDAPTTPFVILGVGYGVVAIAFVVYGSVRQRIVDRALAAGRFEPLDARVIAALTILLVALALATIVLMIGA